MRLLVLALLLVICATAAHAGNLLKVGEAFPKWDLVDHAGNKVSSADLIAKPYLLWFYPKAMTPGCTAEGGGLRDNFAALRKAGIEIPGVSFDTPQDNARFVQEQQFPFRLLSDTDRGLATAVGASDSPQQPVARRISYLVGADGKVLRVYAAVNPSTHATDVLGDLSAPVK